MTWTLLLEQLLNGLQFGLMLFLIAAGLTLVFGIMDIMNLAHGSLYMAGAYVAAETMQRTGSFTAAVLVAAVATGVAGGGRRGAGGGRGEISGGGRSFKKKKKRERDMCNKT